MYRPKNIRMDIRREHGVEVSYAMAHRAKEDAMQRINGSHETAFSELPKYCADLIQANPGTTAIVKCKTEDGDVQRFHCMFVSYPASGFGFSHCRPVLGLDGTHLKSKYRGVLVTATATDANGSLFPLTYGIVDAENDDNWLWFATVLHDVISQYSPSYLAPGVLSFVSNRQKGLLEAIDVKFPGSPHQDGYSGGKIRSHDLSPTRFKLSRPGSDTENCPIHRTRVVFGHNLS
jgi:hypothetical protein